MNRTEVTRTKEQFVRLHQYEFMGLLLDAVTARRSGGEQALWLEHATQAIRNRLARAYDDLIPPVPQEPTKPSP